MSMQRCPGEFPPGASLWLNHLITQTFLVCSINSHALSSVTHDARLLAAWWPPRASLSDTAAELGYRDYYFELELYNVNFEA